MKKSKSRNPIAKALRSSHLRKQVVVDKTKKHDRKDNRAKLKQGKYDNS